MVILLRTQERLQMLANMEITWARVIFKLHTKTEYAWPLFPRPSLEEKMYALITVSLVDDL